MFIRAEKYILTVASREVKVELYSWLQCADIFRLQQAKQVRLDFDKTMFSQTKWVKDVADWASQTQSVSCRRDNVCLSLCNVYQRLISLSLFQIDFVAYDSLYPGFSIDLTRNLQYYFIAGLIYWLSVGSSKYIYFFYSIVFNIKGYSIIYLLALISIGIWQVTKKKLFCVALYNFVELDSHSNLTPYWNNLKQKQKGCIYWNCSS